MDEAFSLESTSGNIFTTFERAIGFESQAPLYFLFLNIWRNIDDSIFFARIFSILAILAAIILFIQLAEEFFNSKNTIWLVLLFTFNPLTIWAALEIRLFALLVLLSTLLIYLYLKRFKSDARLEIRIAFIAISLVGIYTQYYFILLPTAFSLIDLLYKGVKKSKKYFADLAIIYLLCFPIPILAMKHINTIPRKVFNLSGFLHGVKNLLQVQEQFILPLGKLDSNAFGRYLIRAVLLSLIISVIHSNREYIKKIAISFDFFPFWVISAGTIFAIVSSVFIDVELLSIRHLIFLLPFWLLLLAIIIEAAKKKYQNYGILFIIFMVYGFALTNSYHMMAKSGDYKRIANYILKEERAGQPIFIFPNTQYLIFKYYYNNGLNPVVSIPREYSTIELDFYSRRIESQKELDELFSERALEQACLWMIIEPIESYLGVEYNLNLLERYVVEKFDILSTRTFYRETRVYLLRKKGNYVR